MIRKKFILCLISTFGSLALQAQSSISGKITDDKNQALPYVTVRLLQPDSTFVMGAASDSIGVYVFKNVATGSYIIAASSIGYENTMLTVDIKKGHTSVPTIHLHTDNITLGEVEVRGTSFIRKKDMVLIVPDKKQVKHANTGYDLLYNLMIPGIDVNRRTGQVSTIGGNVTIYINGEKADYRDVQALRPNDIEKVEYFDVPTGKYANDVAAINYITKQHTSGGYVAVDGKQTIGYTAGDYNVNSKISKNQTSYSIWAGHNMKKYDGIEAETRETIFFKDYDVNRNQITEDAYIRNNQQYVQFKVGNMNKKRNLSAQVSLIHDQTPKSINRSRLDYSAPFEQSLQSDESKESDNLQPSVNLYGSFNLPANQQIELSLNGTYSQNDYSRTYREEEQLSLTDVKEDMYAVNVSARYNIKLKHRNSFGFYGNHLHRVSSSDYSGDYNAWQHLWSGETLLMLNYAQEINKSLRLMVRPGLSIMNYKLHNNELQSEYSMRMYMNLAYRFARQHQLVWTVNIGNNTPRINNLSDVNQTVDFLQVKRGNPNLKNAKLYETDLVYGGQFGKLNLQAVGVYEFSQDATYSHYLIEDDKLVSTYLSDTNVHAFLFQTNAAYRFSDNFRGKLSASYMHMAITKLPEMKNDCVFGSLDFNYFWKDFSANLYANASTKRLSNSPVFEKNPFTYGLSVSWSKKGWYTEVGTENPFTAHAHRTTHADYGVYRFNKQLSSRTYQQTGYVKVAYSFDFGRKTSKDSKHINKTINSAILKAE